MDIDQMRQGGCAFGELTNTVSCLSCDLYESPLCKAKVSLTKHMIKPHDNGRKCSTCTKLRKQYQYQLKQFMGKIKQERRISKEDKK